MITIESGFEGQEGGDSPGPSKWKQSICRANAEFSLHYYGNAIVIYNQALDQALHEFSVISKNSLDRAVSQVLITKFNLADCYIALGEYDRACDYYIAVLEFLLKVTRGNYDRGVLLKAVMHALSHANFLWTDFLRKHKSKVRPKRLIEYHHAAILLADREIHFSVCH